MKINDYRQLKSVVNLIETEIAKRSAWDGVRVFFYTHDIFLQKDMQRDGIFSEEAIEYCKQQISMVGFAIYPHRMPEDRPRRCPNTQHS